MIVRKRLAIGALPSRYRPERDPKDVGCDRLVGRSLSTAQPRIQMTQETIIEAGRVERHYLHDLWRYRELFRVLAWRDVAVRYKQTVIGVAWALIRPILTMVVFTIVFGKLANLPSDGTAPYALMVLVGMLPWAFFSTSLSDASNRLVGNAHLMTKVYFPRLILPAAAVV